MGRLTAVSAAYASIPPALLVLYVNTALYALCYMMQTPVLPYLTTALGAVMESYGVLMTVFAVVQFVGGLLAGPILDAHGARLVLLASFASSAACYALTGAATSMPVLYASRLPTLLQHAVLATRAAVAEASSEADRARLLGYVGLAYGVGMAAGPALGGALSGLSLRLPAWVAATGSLASVASVLISVPRTRSKRAAAAAADSPEGGAAPAAGARRVTISDLGRVSLLPGVPSLLAVKALAGFAAAVFHSAFPIVVGTRFALQARGAGLLLSYTGVLGIAAQGFVIQWATARADDARIVRVCALAMLAGFAALAAAATVAQLCALLVPLVIAATVLATVNTAQLTKAAPADLGTVVALDMSVGSGVRCAHTPACFACFAHGIAAADTSRGAASSAPRWRRMRCRAWASAPSEELGQAPWASSCCCSTPAPSMPRRRLHRVRPSISSTLAAGRAGREDAARMGAPRRPLLFAERYIVPIYSARLRARQPASAPSATRGARRRVRHKRSAPRIVAAL